MKQFTKTSSEIRKVGDNFKRAVEVKKFRTEDGDNHEFTTFGLMNSRSGAVIALTPDNRVITTYQFRPGPERWMYELPGGGINEGEKPEVGALRELREETGYISDKVEFLGKLDARDAYMNGDWYYYLALDCQPSRAGQELDVTEFEQGVEVKLISIEELINNAKTSQMTDPVAVLLAYDKLRQLEDKSAK